MPSPDKNLTEQANLLLNQSSSGSLATHSLKHPGFPFASLVQYATSENGDPILLLSSMATHNRNIQLNNHASLLITANPNGSESNSDLSAGRLTLIGTVEPILDDQLLAAGETYLSKHPEAQQWISFDDFQLNQLTIFDAYLVAGFGSMGWVSAEELRVGAG